MRSAERIKLLTKNALPIKAYFRNKGERKTFSGKQKLKEFVTTRLVLKEILKGVIQAKMKGCQLVT